MQTITAIEAAEAATNIHRVDWIHGAAELVLTNQVQYDRSTPKSKEAFISLDNVMEDVMGEVAAERLLMRWFLGSECCDERDALGDILHDEVGKLISQMADDFNIGVE